MQNNEDKVIGASANKAPYEADDVTTRTVNELIPIWIDPDTQQSIKFTLEITDTITEDLIINVVKCYSHTFFEEWEQDVRDFLGANYSNIQDIAFWI